MQDIIFDWAKVGTMLIVAHVIAGGDIMDRNWQRASLFTLLGFTAYHIATRNFIDTANFGTYKPLADEWSKVGTMLLVSRLLSGLPFNEQWMRSSLFTLLGFSAYHLVTGKFVQGGNITANTGLAAAIDDAVKFGTMFIVAHALAGGDFGNRAWQINSLGTIAGFAVFQLLVRGILRL